MLCAKDCFVSGEGKKERERKRQREKEKEKNMLTHIKYKWFLHVYYFILLKIDCILQSVTVNTLLFFILQKKSQG